MKEEYILFVLIGYMNFVLIGFTGQMFANYTDINEHISSAGLEHLS